MSEQIGDAETFARLLGRSPEPEQKPEPDESSKPEPVEDALLVSLRQPKAWAQAFVEAMHGPGEPATKPEAEPEDIDFDGGARKPMPQERDPGEAHNDFLLELLRQRPQGGGGQW